MKSTLLLTKVALVVLVVVQGGTFNSAKTLEWNEKSAFEKRWNEGRVRRDFQTFQSQIDYETSLSLADLPPACSSVPCTSNLNLSLCSAFCQADPTVFQQIINSLSDCYNGGLCGKNFTSFTLTNVNVPLGMDGSDGQCTLYGSNVSEPISNQSVNVTTTLASRPPVVTQLDFPTMAAYTIDYYLEYTFQGLSVRCQTISLNNTCDCQKSCAGKDQNSQNEKKQVVADSTAASFDRPITGYIAPSFQPVFLYSPGKTPFTQVGGLRVSEFATFVNNSFSSIYKAQAFQSLNELFLNYNIYNSLATNYFSIMSGLVEDFRANKCLSTCNR